MLSKPFNSVFCKRQSGIAGSVVSLNSLSLCVLNHRWRLQSYLAKRIQALCSGAPSQQVREAHPFFQEFSGSGRMDTRCVTIVPGDLGRGRGRRLCLEKQGGLSDWEEGTKCTRARLVWGCQWDQ